FFSSRRRHTRSTRDWSSDVCSSDLRRHLQQRVLRALSLGEQRQRLTCDVGLEMRAVLMRLEGGFVAEQFVEQKLSRIFLCPRDQIGRASCRERVMIAEWGGRLEEAH